MEEKRDTGRRVFSGDMPDARRSRERMDAGESSMNHNESEDPDILPLKEAIHRMPDLTPPDVLLQSVMHSVRAKRLPLWARVIRWAGTPRSISITPLRVAPAAAVFIAVCLALAFNLFKDEKATLTIVQGDRIPVVLALHSPEARSVEVIGSFNGWQAEKCEQQTVNGETRWTVTLLLPSGRYEYAFVVDGEKIVPDPGAGLQEEDGFGNQNAILFVGNGNGNSI
ncbi:MAG: glycogen-binding domain-containing protein [Syntrophobacteraceae bacterium]